MKYDAHSNWQHPRIANPEAGIDDRIGIAAEAAAALARRRTTYPDLVTGGKLDAAVAEADLGAWQAISQDWRWIAVGDGAPADRATLAARIDALDTAIDRFFTAMDRSGHTATSLGFGQREQITRIAAMRWCAQAELRPTGCLHPRDAAAIGHDYRKQNGHPTLGQMQSAHQQKALR